MPAAFAFRNEGWMPFGSSGQMRIMATFFWMAAFIATIWACGLYWPPIVSKFMPRALALRAMPSFRALIAGFASTGGMNAIVFDAFGFAAPEPANAALAMMPLARRGRPLLSSSCVPPISCRWRMWSTG